MSSQNRNFFVKPITSRLQLIETGVFWECRKTPTDLKTTGMRFSRGFRSRDFQLNTFHRLFWPFFWHQTLEQHRWWAEKTIQRNITASQSPPKSGTLFRLNIAIVIRKFFSTEMGNHSVIASESASSMSCYKFQFQTNILMWASCLPGCSVNDEPQFQIQNGFTIYFTRTIFGATSPYSFCRTPYHWPPDVMKASVPFHFRCKPYYLVSGVCLIIRHWKVHFSFGAMPSNDMFDDMKLKLDQIVDYAVSVHSERSTNFHLRLSPTTTPQIRFWRIEQCTCTSVQSRSLTSSDVYISGLR